MAIEIYPVVHVNEPSQALDQSTMALEMGADGVYLIVHGNRETTLLVNSFNKVLSQFPDGFVGLNFLQFHSAARTLSYLLECDREDRINRLPNGLWVDDADVEKEESLNLRVENTRLAGLRYLGGVAFKYTPAFTDDPEQAALEAVRLEPFVDVVTTSGRGTGKAPSLSKISAMRAVTHKPIAVASGMSAENLIEYSGLVDQLLVSTSIEISPYSGIFNPKKLTELIDLAHNI